MPDLDYKSILWIITILIWIYAYYPYIRDILKGKTKPHIFSWIVFVIMDIVAFFIQYWDNAGPWAWGILTTGIWALIVLILALKNWEKNITKSDLIALFLALGSVVFYILLNNPVYAQIMIFIILASAMYPTFRKSYHKPSQETLSLYVIAALRSILSIFAVINFSFLTIGLSFFIIIINTLFVSMVLIRRKKLY